MTASPNPREEGQAVEPTAKWLVPDINGKTVTAVPLSDFASMRARAERAEERAAEFEQAGENLAAEMIRWCARADQAERERDRYLGMLRELYAALNVESGEGRHAKAVQRIPSMVSAERELAEARKALAAPTPSTDPAAP